jgi:hypothetical protein
MELLSVTQWQKLRKAVALRVTSKRPAVTICVTEKGSGQWQRKFEWSHHVVYRFKYSFIIYKGKAVPLQACGVAQRIPGS